MRHTPAPLDPFAASVLSETDLSALDDHLDICRRCRRRVVVPPEVDLDSTWNAIVERLGDGRAGVRRLSGAAIAAAAFLVVAAIGATTLFSLQGTRLEPGGRGQDPIPETATLLGSSDGVTVWAWSNGAEVCQRFEIADIGAIRGWTEGCSRSSTWPVPDTLWVAGQSDSIDPDHGSASPGDVDQGHASPGPWPDHVFGLTDAAVASVELQFPGGETRRIEVFGNSDVNLRGFAYRFDEGDIGWPVAVTAFDETGNEIGIATDF